MKIGPNQRRFAGARAAFEQEQSPASETADGDVVEAAYAKSGLAFVCFAHA
jgi:hypothetical protein